MANQSDASVERKRVPSPNNSQQSSETAVQERNILHKFRTFNYIFTLAALPPDATNKNERIKEATEKYVILRSSGKRQGELKGGAIAEGFNSLDTGSPGQYDLFIDNVSIETYMAFNKNTNMSLATKLSFDVFEPLSINGFPEALSAAALSAGNVNHLVSSYVLKMEFLGYSDKEQGPSSAVERIDEQGTRYFVIQIRNVQARMDENGTKYKVEAVAKNEMGFSDANAIKESIQMKGSNVVEICENLMEALTGAAFEAAKTEYGNTQYADRYEIVFPTPNWEKGEFDFSTPYKKFKEARIREITEDPSVFTFPAPGTVESAYTGPVGSRRGPTAEELADFQRRQAAAQNPNQSSNSYDPNITSIMYTRGAKIHDIIASIIRDSEFARKIVKNLEEAIKDQFVEYFHVALETEIKDQWNPYTLSPSYIYRYIVYPYKMHFTRFPLFQRELSQREQNSLIKRYVRRKYDYLYTGKNVDIRSFDLVFNYLYYQSYPRSMNNANFGVLNVGIPTEEKTGKLLTQVPGSETENNTTAPLSPRISDPRRGEIVGPGGNASRPIYDTYDALVKNMHQAILDNLSLIKCDIEILGDPYFLVTGGIGNSRPKLTGPTITENGEAPYQTHEVFVGLEFRNPRDINPKTGQYIFDKERIPYNGCYRVTQVVSRFQEGLFTQKLQLLRVPGQPVVYSGRGKQSTPAENFAFFEDIPLPDVSASSAQA